MKTHESAENYLETILILQRKKGHVHAVDVANALGFSKPSVSIAMKNLRQRDLVFVDIHGCLVLTPEGLEIAERIYERHTLFTNWLISLGVNPEVAAEDACRVEHVISQESFEAIKRLAEEIRNSSHAAQSKE